MGPGVSVCAWVWVGKRTVPRRVVGHTASSHTYTHTTSTHTHTHHRHTPAPTPAHTYTHTTYTHTHAPGGRTPGARHAPPPACTSPPRTALARGGGHGPARSASAAGRACRGAAARPWVGLKPRGARPGAGTGSAAGAAHCLATPRGHCCRHGRAGSSLGSRRVWRRRTRWMRTAAATTAARGCQSTSPGHRSARGAARSPRQTPWQASWCCPATWHRQWGWRRRGTRATLPLPPVIRVAQRRGTHWRGIRL